MNLHPKEVNFTLENIEKHALEACQHGKQYVEALVAQLQHQELDDLVKKVREIFHNQQAKKNA